MLSAFARGEASPRLRKMITSLHRRLDAGPRDVGRKEQAA